SDFALVKMPPGAVDINSGAATTSGASVTLKLSAKDRNGVGQMRISNDGVFDTEPWETYAASKAWTLSGGNGLKTVYAQFKDGLGNISPTYTDTISLYGAGAVSSSINSPVGGALLSGSTFTVTGSAVDGDGSGVQKVDLSFDGGNTWYAASGTTAWSYQWSLPVDGQFTIKSRATRNSGAVELPGAGVTVIADRTRPVAAITYPANGATISGPACTVTGTATDGSGSGVGRVEVSTDGGATWKAASGTTAWSYAWAIPAGERNTTIKARAIDVAGNPQSPFAEAAVVQDNAGPSASTLVWTRQRGTTADDIAKGVAVDAAGNVYTAGTSRGQLDGNSNPTGAVELFLSKFDQSGNWLWTKQMWTVSDVAGVAAAQDGVYVAGTVLGSLDGCAVLGGKDAFLVKFDTDGNKLWTRQAGSTADDIVNTVTAGNNGEVFIAGYTTGSIDGCVNAGDGDMFAIKYDRDGNKLWTQEMGEQYWDNAIGASADAAGNFYMTGFSNWDLAVVKYGPDGRRIWMAKDNRPEFPPDNRKGQGVVADGSGNVYTAGWTCNGYEGSANANLYLTRYSPDGEQLWARQVSSAGYHEDRALGISYDPGGFIYVAGYTKGWLDGKANAGDFDYFVSKYDVDGNLMWTQQRGSASEDEANCIAIDEDGRLYTAGSTKGGLEGNTNTGQEDLFVARFAGDIMTINSGGAFTNTVDATLHFHAQDISGITEARVSGDGAFEGVPWDSFSASWAWTLMEGENTVYAQLKDGAGNITAVIKSVTVETTIPSSAITAPQDGGFIVGRTCMVTGSAADPDSGIRKVEVSIDGGASWKLAGGKENWSYLWTLPLDGSYTILSRATDLAGNVEAPNPGPTVTIEGSFPSSSITAPAASATVSGAACTVTGTAADAGSGV
ncbi:MAG TPA: Ig-like domain-containing protein, partial [Nitrospirota bacterium]